MKTLFDILGLGSEAVARVLVDTMSGSRWTKCGMDRVYFNDFGKLFFDLTTGKFDTREATAGYEDFIAEVESRDFSEDYDYIVSKSVNGIFSQADGWDSALSAIKYVLKSGLVDGVFQTSRGVFVYKHIKTLAISDMEAVKSGWYKDSELFKKRLDRRAPFREVISAMVKAGGINEDGYYALPIPVLTDKYLQDMHFNSFRVVYEESDLECACCTTLFEKSGLVDLYRELVDTLNQAYENRAEEVEEIEEVEVIKGYTEEDLKVIYEEVKADAKETYKKYGLVEDEPHKYTCTLGMVYIDKDDKIFYKNDITLTPVTSPSERYAKKKVCIVSSNREVISYQDYEFTKAEVKEWFEKEVSEDIDFIPFEDFLEELKE